MVVREFDFELFPEPIRLRTREPRDVLRANQAKREHDKCLIRGRDFLGPSCCHGDKTEESAYTIAAPILRTEETMRKWPPYWLLEQTLYIK
jgi:hypothetical protein